jgi:hypothetical protein
MQPCKFTVVADLRRWLDEHPNLYISTSDLLVLLEQIESDEFINISYGTIKHRGKEIRVVNRFV